MRLAAKVCSYVVVFAVGIGPASASHLSDFDLDKLENWSDALAVCDVARFLLTDPDLSADTILVAGRGNTHTVLYGPLYAPPTNFFSDAVHEAFDNIRKAGFVTAASYGRSRIHYAGLMIDAYRGATLAEKHHLADQMDLCYHLAARAGVKLEAIR